MKINNIVVRNLGPIHKLDLGLNGENVVFTGTNGSGKTFLISSIVDYIHESLRKIGFDDVLPTKGTGYSYFRLTNPSYIALGEPKGFIWIDGEINGEQLYYLEQYGYEFPEQISSETGIPIEKLPWPKNSYAKNISSIDSQKHQELRSYTRNSATFYIPATHYEEDFWRNEIFFNKDFSYGEVVTTTLGRPVEIKTSARENYVWLVNELFDFSLSKNPRIAMIYRMINEIMGLVLGRENQISVHVTPNRNNRIVVNETTSGTHVLNSLKDLSLGQSSVLYMFMNILRYGGINVELTDVHGLVVIDEIDTHLHDDLKRNVIPKLIKMFPKVQFIITTHDPSCLISLEETEAIQNIISLPAGEKIYASEYEELKTAREHLFTATKESRKLCEQIGETEKPALLVEDEYTELYKVAWLKLKKKEFNAENLDEIFADECPFCIIPACGCAKIQALLQREYLIEKLKDKKMVALFDFDEAFINFNNLPKNIWNEEEGDDSSGLVRNCVTAQGLHAMLLPVPPHRKDMASKKYKAKSLLEVELLFSDETLGDSCGIDRETPGNFRHFIGNKSTFWRTAIDFEQEKFGAFTPLFAKVEELLT